MSTGKGAKGKGCPLRRVGKSSGILHTAGSPSTGAVLMSRECAQNHRERPQFFRESRPRGKMIISRKHAMGSEAQVLGSDRPACRLCKLGKESTSLSLGFSIYVMGIATVTSEHFIRTKESIHVKGLAHSKYLVILLPFLHSS